MALFGPAGMLRESRESGESHEEFMESIDNYKIVETYKGYKIKKDSWGGNPKRYLVQLKSCRKYDLENINEARAYIDNLVFEYEMGMSRLTYLIETSSYNEATKTKLQEFIKKYIKTQYEVG